MKEDHYIYMQRCLQLAMNGRTSVSPNPMVGAVIVHNNEIIGEGYHIRCGSAHAEVNAIHSVRDKNLLKESTIYVSLEPCCHYGKTPPCADLIIENGIPKVVVGCLDPFVKVAGKGVQKLRDAGKEVIVGIMEKECHQLISHFITYHTLRRPYIILKWAESSDGYIDMDRSDGSPAKLSTDLTAMLVHKRRAEADAIMVGTHTAFMDNPSLTVRNWYGKNPVRIVLDKNLILNKNLHLFDEDTKTIIFTTHPHESNDFTEYVTLNKEDYLLPQIMNNLYDRKIQTLLVEGGSKLLQSFINDNLWDEMFVEKSCKTLCSGVKAPEINHKNSYSVDIHFGVPILHYVREKHDSG